VYKSDLRKRGRYAFYFGMKKVFLLKVEKDVIFEDWKILP